MDEITIKWQQTHELILSNPDRDILPGCVVHDVATGPKLLKPIWHDLDGVTPDSPELRNKTPVVIKDGDSYVVNTQSLFDKYRKEGKQVRLFPSA